MKQSEVVTVTVRIPPYLKERLDAEVARNRSSQSSEVIRLLRSAWMNPTQQAKAVR
jgi:Arc/MetJ-type ribon-helix-helix transcriptional regulator